MNFYYWVKLIVVMLNVLLIRSNIQELVKFKFKQRVIYPWSFVTIISFLVGVGYLLSASFLPENEDNLIMEIAILVYFLCLSIQAGLCYVAFKLETKREANDEEE